MTIRATINVTKIKWNEQKVAAVLANDPKIQADIRSKAEAVAATARSRVASAPRKKVAKQRVGGFYFSERPDAIAKTIQVKKSAPLIVTSNARGRSLPVALVVADHPYSPYYLAEFASALPANAAAGKWVVQGQQAGGTP